MEFTVFPLVMIALCAVMMLVMMRGMHGGRNVLSSARSCCGFGSASGHEHVNRTPGQSWWPQQSTSGNQSFDEYRADTLRRLEQEQHAFQDFLARLRTAKDKAEFDEFMTARRSGHEPQPPT
jgi:Protein of unknown function (DUF2852)